MRKVFKGIAISSVVLASAFYMVRPALFKAHASADPTPTAPSKFYSRPELPNINQIFDEVNAERIAHGLKPVTRDAKLTKLAGERADDMATNHYYAHKNPQGKYFYDIMNQEGITAAYACENLDLEATLITDKYVTDWLTSVHGHRECMLNQDVTQAGYAVMPFTVPGPGQLDTQMYVVVTIYAQPGA